MTQSVPQRFEAAEGHKTAETSTTPAKLATRVLLIAFFFCPVLQSVCQAGGPNHLDTSAWRRDERAVVYFGEQRARYASISRTQNGRLLILFTHQSEQQEKDGTADLFLVRRTSDGDWWSYPETVYEGQRGEPRAYGTMTTLKSGRIIAPFVEVDDQSASFGVRMLSSDDDGQSWQVGSSVDVLPLVWAAPYGRPFEQHGQLFMPVFGALTQKDLQGHSSVFGTIALYR